MKNYIPLYPPNIPKKSIYYLKKCVDENYVSTGGGLIKLFEKKISKFTKSKYSVALNSGTSALHLALKVIGVKKQDEVIVPTFTFISPVEVIAQLGLRHIVLPRASHSAENSRGKNMLNH